MRVGTFTVLSGFVLATTIGPVHASSDAAWATFEKRVTKACVAESGIRNARPSTIVGLVAMLVSDRARGSSLSKLCLYDKRAGKASVAIAESWAAPPQAR